MQKFSAAAIPGLLAALFLGACSDPVTATDSASADPPALPAPAASAPACTGDAYIRGRLLGAVEADVDWSADAISCQGGPRPDGDGARLRFARASDDGAGLAVIIAIPGLSRRSTGTEFAANVTLILEGEARFFSTQNRESCWADISGNELVGDERYAVEGELYCIAPLAEVNGTGSITLDGLGFRGAVNWGKR